MPRRSPLNDHLPEGEWQELNGGLFPNRLPAEDDSWHRETVALTDFSALRKCGLKGPGVAAWLETRGVPLPAEIYSLVALDGGLAFRLGADEVFLQSGFAHGAIDELLDADAMAATEGVAFVTRSDACFALRGPRAHAVLAQTCGYDFQRSESRRVVLTRVAGVSAMILSNRWEDSRAFQMWIDPSYAIYLWTALESICHDLDGGAVGMSADDVRAVVPGRKQNDSVS